MMLNIKTDVCSKERQDSIEQRKTRVYFILKRVIMRDYQQEGMIIC